MKSLFCSVLIGLLGVFVLLSCGSSPNNVEGSGYSVEEFNEQFTIVLEEMILGFREGYLRQRSRVLNIPEFNAARLNLTTSADNTGVVRAVLLNCDFRNKKSSEEFILNIENYLKSKDWVFVWISGTGFNVYNHVGYNVSFNIKRYSDITVIFHIEDLVVPRF